MKKEEIKENLKNSVIWLRVFFILIFVLFYAIAEALFYCFSVVQIVFSIITGEQNDRISNLLKSLTKYLYQLLKYIGMQSEYKPFPFNDWPNEDDEIKKIKN